MRVIKITFINFLILLFIVAIFEFAVAVIFPDISLFKDSSNLYQIDRYNNSYGLSPNIKGYSRSAEVITDDNGFRIDPSLSAPIKKHKIIVLGDSISFGIGVAASDAFPFILQRQLRDYQIINSSVNGYFANDYYNVLTYLIKSGVEFDGVIVSICLNDFSSKSQVFIQEQIKEKYYLNYPNKTLRFFKYTLDHYFGLNDILMGYSRTYHLIKYLLIDTSKNYYLADKTMYDAPDIETVIENGFMKIYDRVKEERKWIVFFVFPFEYQLRRTSFTNPDIYKPQKMIGSIAEKKKLPVVDLLPLFKKHLDESGRSSTELYQFNDAMHFSLIGHNLAAQCIYEGITKRGLLISQCH